MGRPHGGWAQPHARHLQGRASAPADLQRGPGLFRSGAGRPGEHAGSCRSGQGTDRLGGVGESDQGRRRQHGRLRRLVLVGGPGAPLDITGNPTVHRLVEKAYGDEKIIGALCYAVGALVWSRWPDNRGKSISTAGRWSPIHANGTSPATCRIPSTARARTTPAPTSSPRASCTRSPSSSRTRSGADGKVISDPTASREHPLVIYDHPFVSALSVESSSAFGDKARRRPGKVR